MADRAVADVLKRYSDRLISLPGVVGTSEGLCEGQPCIKVFVTKATPDLVRRIPPDLEGVRVSVEETGAFRPRDP